jgi:hypothetical protein
MNNERDTLDERSASAASRGKRERRIEEWRCAREGR